MLEAPIVEIFSSIQGEGLLVGRRQIFVRFAGCNLNCSYCDTEASKSSKNGTLRNVDYVVNKINELKTPDLHSVSFTGGEPSLYADFIKEVIDKINFPGFLETNGILTKEINKIDNLKYASLDIKLPENLEDAFDSKIISSEIDSINLLIDKGINVYCKIVVFPNLDLKLFENLIFNVSKAINKKDNLSIIIQPVSPIELWKNDKDKLFKFSEITGKYMDVLIIPQLHKFMNIE
ncbi:7-carboxy-7-deazaguanine synthase QueE [Methanobrevibacter wolinii]|uniref:7-carboxy-7-deazaguanine synthase QueE n=1 Tax=Methanobrevibacter wolinii TaxID=190977 RepID=UPI000694873B|nr:7-carboxy-7-deazaguanine synthase QueE [Methanobrevibacter wolinii]MDD5960501.1 7-carboxy-7-deazaguanine synthase QueE [Methanobrevibacter wolinii]